MRVVRLKFRSGHHLVFCLESKQVSIKVKPLHDVCDCCLPKIEIMSNQLDNQKETNLKLENQVSYII